MMSFLIMAQKNVGLLGGLGKVPMEEIGKCIFKRLMNGIIGTIGIFLISVPRPSLLDDYGRRCGWAFLSLLHLHY